MATPTDTVRDLIAAYPCVAANRTQALHHILITGDHPRYHWHRGEAVPLDPVTTCTREGRHRWISEALVQRLASSSASTKEWLSGICPEQERRTRAAVLAEHPGPLAGDPYPPHPAALLLSVPADVRADWLQAARSLAALILPAWSSPAPHWSALDAALPPQVQAELDQAREQAVHRVERLLPRGCPHGRGTE